MRKTRPITATLTGLALVVSLATPALAQQRTATGYLRGDSLSLGMIMNMAEANQMRITTLGETVNNHELRLDEIEIKAITEVRTANNGPYFYPSSRAKCPTGFTPFTCLAQRTDSGIQETVLGSWNQRTQRCQYSHARLPQSAQSIEQVSCLRVGITAAAVGGDDAATGGQ